MKRALPLLFFFFLSLPKGSWDAARWNCSDLHYFVAQGTVLVGWSDQATRETATVYRVGSTIDAAAGSIFFLGASEDALLIATCPDG